MTKNQIYYLTSFFLLWSFVGFGQTDGIKIPNYNDKYSNYVKQLESGETNINYADFRNSFLQSQQYSQKSMSYDSLKRETYTAIKNSDYKEVVRLTKAMLSLDYTSMFAHMYLQETYKILGDTSNQTKYHSIEFGLLNSIIKSGDGKTCKTGWHVTQIEEEYFIINMMDAALQSQSINKEGKNMCDKMVVKTENGDIKTYYFEANKVFEMENKMFEK